MVHVYGVQNIVSGEVKDVTLCAFVFLWIELLMLWWAGGVHLVQQGDVMDTHRTLGKPRDKVTRDVAKVVGIELTAK